MARRSTKIRISPQDDCIDVTIEEPTTEATIRFVDLDAALRAGRAIVNAAHRIKAEKQVKGEL